MMNNTQIVLKKTICILFILILLYALFFVFIEAFTLNFLSPKYKEDCFWNTSSNVVMCVMALSLFYSIILLINRFRGRKKRAVLIIHRIICCVVCMVCSAMAIVLVYLNVFWNKSKPIVIDAIPPLIGIVNMLIYPIRLVINKPQVL